jgi:hypothetical protein
MNKSFGIRTKEFLNNICENRKNMIERGISKNKLTKDDVILFQKKFFSFNSDEKLAGIITEHEHEIRLIIHPRYSCVLKTLEDLLDEAKQFNS